MYLCISPYTVSWPHSLIFFAQRPLGLSNIYLEIRFLNLHIVSLWWCMGGFLETSHMNVSKLDSTGASKHYQTTYNENTHISHIGSPLRDTI